tara:strand:- start:254 stop:484 length:231 start_codon:yes stop_codon:yes gene_type:complete
LEVEVEVDILTITPHMYMEDLVLLEVALEVDLGPMMDHKFIHNGLKEGGNRLFPLVAEHLVKVIVVEEQEQDIVQT